MLFTDGSSPERPSAVAPVFAHQLKTSRLERHNRAVRGTVLDHFPQRLAVYAMS
jgi:hypothetical protein